MIVLQHRTSTVDVELARVLNVTARAWGMPGSTARPAWRLESGTTRQSKDRLFCASNWSRVPAQGLRWAI